MRGHGYRFVAEVRRIEEAEKGRKGERKIKNDAERSEPPATNDFEFQTVNRNDDERTTNDELPKKDQTPKTKDRIENPKSKIQNPKSNVVALAAWRHEAVADDGGAAELVTNEIQKEPILKTAPSDVAPKIKSNKFRRAALAICAVLVTAGISYTLYKFANPAPMIFEAKKTTRITATGKVKLAAISPDGKYVTYAQEENGERQSLWTRHIASESAVQIAPPADVQYRGLNVSPDGNQLYYVLGEGSLYQMPVLGGAVKKIADGLDIIGNKIILQD